MLKVRGISKKRSHPVTVDAIAFFRRAQITRHCGQILLCNATCNAIAFTTGDAIA
ncbi:hypothetical protein [Microseira wollei]|uniref:hypothetical protein n=1 Tax=Microseira wollei TaxID=467598 RepID=UPI001CFCB3AD|nr:hypothetical protein [Microseira wollei]